MHSLADPLPVFNSVLHAYEHELGVRGFQSDSAQLRAVQALQRCVDEWAEFKKKKNNFLYKIFSPKKMPKGVYMYGGVGRGKSFLMDCFFAVVPVERKVRLHFHEFMREVHKELHQLQGTRDPLQVLAAKMAQRYELICFDEFHIADIRDAMILHRLLSALFSHQVGFVTTSNFIPDGLYPGGLHRDRIFPAIQLLNENMEILSVDNGIDYRQRALENLSVYHSPLGEKANKAMQETFSLFAESEKIEEATNFFNQDFQIQSRSIEVLNRKGGVIWFDFRALCGNPLAHGDYLEIANQCHTVLLSNIPKMPVSMASAARRFTWLVDVFYDRRIKLIISAEVDPEFLYTEGPMVHEFVRTVSRLNEMQSKEYFALECRDVDTGLT